MDCLAANGFKLKGIASDGLKGLAVYTHKRLRSTYLSLGRNLQRLWAYYEYPDLGLPNTNNAVEALISELLYVHNLHK